MVTTKVLILAGGQSSRMGSPKHLLPLPSTGQPLYQHLISVIHAADPGTQTVYFSIADGSELDDALRLGVHVLPTKAGDQRIDLVKIPDGTQQDIGPAAGLLAAHQHDPDAVWLVIACDFPLLAPAALYQLREEFEDPVTCFVNKQGFSEPLLAIWTPYALQCLSENVVSGRCGPNYTVKRLNGKLVSPAEDDWILNTNNPGEWEATRSRIIAPQSMEGV